MRPALAVVAALLVAGCGSKPHLQSDWERENEALLAKEKTKEELALPTPPAYPRNEDLIAFEPAVPSGGFRYFIDGASLKVGDEKVRIIQYVLVARSNAGVDNVSFEGLRCATVEYRVYALGQNGAWSGRPSDWRPITSAKVRPLQAALLRDYFCPQGTPVRSVGEGLNALRQGGHPFAKGFSGDALLGR